MHALGFHDADQPRPRTPTGSETLIIGRDPGRYGRCPGRHPARSPAVAVPAGTLPGTGRGRRTRPAAPTYSGRGARLISSLPISAADRPSWQTRRTASAMGSSTPCRAPSSQIDVHDLTPSAT